MTTTNKQILKGSNSHREAIGEAHLDGCEGLLTTSKPTGADLYKSSSHAKASLEILDGSALLRERELLRSVKNPHGIVPMSRGKWWRGVADGIHPAPIRLGPKITAWRVAEVRAWLAKQAEVSATQSSLKRLSPRAMTSLRTNANNLGLALDQVRRLDSGQLMLLLSAKDGTTLMFSSVAELEEYLGQATSKVGA